MADAATITIGGVTALSAQMVIMAQLRRLLHVGDRLDKYFDVLNYPVASVIIAIADPPWPYWSWQEWQHWMSLTVSLAVLASVTAKKAGDAQAPERKRNEGNGGTAVLGSGIASDSVGGSADGSGSISEHG